MSKNTLLSNLINYISANSSGNVVIVAPTSGLALDVNGTGRFTGQLTLGSTITNGTFTYTLPSATGTLALTSALSAYLPLSGGTLTGALNGTSATFSNNVIVNGSSIDINPSSGTPNITIRSGNTFRGYIEGNSAGGMSFGTGAGAAICLTLASTGAATFSSSVTASTFTSNVTSGVFLNNSSGGTNATQLRINNTSGDLRLGIESSAGQAIQIGTLAYAAVLGNQANNALQFTTNGTARMTIAAGGNVGIGTATPLSLLDVCVLSSGARRLLVNYDDSLVTIKSASSGGGGENLRLIGDNIIFNSGSSGSGTERMRIFSGGDIRINYNPGGGNGLYFNDATASAVMFYIIPAIFVGSAPYNTNRFIATNSSNISFEAGGSPRMTITSSGTVGIGTTPSINWGSRSVLQLGAFGTSLSGFNGGGGATNLMHNAVANGFSYTYLINGGATSQYMDGSDIVWANAPSGTAGNAITFVERMKITSGGSLIVASGVYDTSPSSAWYARQGGNNRIIADGNGYVYMPFLTTGSGIDTLGWWSTSGTSYVSNGMLMRISSSQRYKKNIRSLEVDSSKIFELNTISYENNENTAVDGLTSFGLLAEDVAEKIPMLATYNEENQPEGVQYNMLSVLLLEEVKKLKAEIEILKQK